MPTVRYRTGLAGEWRASSLVTKVDGDEVTSWTSEALGAYTLTGAAGATGVYKEDQLNGRPIVRFGGTDEHMVSGVNWSSLMSTNYGVIVAVVKVASAPGAGAYKYIVSGANTQTPQLRLFNVSHVQAMNYCGAAQTIDRAWTTPTGVALPGLWQILAWRHSGQNLWLHLNDAFDVTCYDGAGGAATGLGATMDVGGYSAGASYTEMDLAHLLVYDTSGLSGPMPTAALATIFADLCAEYFSPNDATLYSPLIRGTSTEQVRDTLTRRLLARERRERQVLWTGGRALLDYEIGSDVNLAHPMGPDPAGSATPPSPGWPDTATGRQPHRVKGIVENADDTFTLQTEPLS